MGGPGTGVSEHGFAAMCNRVGPEDAMDFAGQSLLAGPDGDFHCLARDSEELLRLDVPPEEAAQTREARPWLEL